MRQNRQGTYGPVAQSNYRQYRLTATQEVSGRFTYSVYAKPLNAAWNEQQCLIRATFDAPPRPILSTEDVVMVLMDLLREQTLPGIG